MKNDQFDTILKTALETKVDDVNPSPYLLQKIKSQVAQQRKERFSMKLFSVKKLAIIGILCFATVTCYAAVKYSGGVVSLSKNNEITSIDQVANFEDQVGFSPKVVESFDNGFTFDQGGTGETYGTDSDGKPSGKTYKTMTLTYRNKENKWVLLGIEGGSPYAETGELTKGYSSQMYKFVPPNYELTEEDKKAEADGSLMISYGSEKVELTQMENYNWEEDGLYYSLTASDCNLGESEMTHMVEQIKNQ